MSEVEMAIRVEGLSKQYRLASKQRRTNTLRDTLTDAFMSPFRRVGNIIHGEAPRTDISDSTIWALNNVSFDVKRGEVLGIIGRNGAGKTTLLKILSCITEPTKGCARIRGRVGSLLEVGTGFHSELTGRENIYLNGAILGMKKATINNKFDEIVAFAEVEKFIDTPVKHYSSGMYMRLAFAVAAHLEPEILIVDEVLAVGDATFQKKCLNKMENVGKAGRTVLFVSHNMIAVQSLCERAIWLNDGQIVQDGQPSEVISDYLQISSSILTERRWQDITAAPGNDEIRLHSASVRPADGSISDQITVRTPLVIEFKYWNLKPNAYFNINLKLYNEQGTLVLEAGPNHEPIWWPLPAGLFRDVCYIPGSLLNDGVYRVKLDAVSNKGRLVHQEIDIIVFNIQDTKDYREGWFGKWGGVVRPILEWDRKLVKTDKMSAADDVSK